MTTKYRAYAGMEEGERAYLFGLFKKRRKREDDATHEAYYLKHHVGDVDRLTKHANRGGFYYGEMTHKRMAGELAASAWNGRHFQKWGREHPRHTDEHHHALARQSIAFQHENQKRWTGQMRRGEELT